MTHFDDLVKRAEEVFGFFDIIRELLSEATKNLKQTYKHQKETLKNLDKIKTSQKKSGKIIRNIASDLNDLERLTNSKRKLDVLDVNDFELI